MTEDEWIETLMADFRSWTGKLTPSVADYGQAVAWCHAGISLSLVQQMLDAYVSRHRKNVQWMSLSYIDADVQELHRAWSRAVCPASQP